MINTELSSVERWLESGRGEPDFARTFTGLGHLEQGMFLSALQARADVPVLCVLASPSDARQVIDNLTFFGGDELGKRVHYLPPLDFDFYRGLLPNPEVLCERNVALFHALNDPKRRVFVTSAPALLQKVFPPQEYLRATRVLAPNDEVDRDDLVQGLLELGYQRQPTALDPGVFSVRGGVLDIFCPLYEKPLRIEFFGDLIDEIRFFEIQTQRSLDKIEKAFLIPVGQTMMPRGEAMTAAAAKIKERLDHLGIPKAAREELIQKAQDRVLTTEFHFLFPYLSGGSVASLEFFPKETLLFWEGRKKIEEAVCEIELPRLKKSLELFEKEPVAIAEAHALFADERTIRAALESDRSRFFEAFQSRESDALLRSDPIDLSTECEGMKKQGQAAHFEPHAQRLKLWMDEGYRVQIVCHTRTHAERIVGLLEPFHLPTVVEPDGQPSLPGILASSFETIHLWRGYLSQSRLLPSLKLVILSEEEIFGRKKRAPKSAAWASNDPARLLSSFRDLKTSDFIVHREFGIGRYLGLKTMTFQGVENDYTLLEYRDGDKLYIPVYRLNVLQKYVGGEGAGPALDKLGGDRWSKAKGKAERAVAELAAEFLKIHAKRRLVPAKALSPPGQDYHEFEMEFPFDETPDQQKAIDDVMNDLSQPHPMDRLICGDVGYGKTEVAMRAAFRAAFDGKQAAVLVPTTVLAFQHFENFKKRFKNAGVRIEMVSRLRTTAEVKQVLADVKQGKVDILIGTHRLLSADVEFKDLQLIVIDEEHRFGVVHKERLKKMTETVHVLSMTATPIPRTLNMAMTGIKEISIITTPPPDRLSVRTFVCRNSSEVITEAISNELGRDGQVFFVHNRIESIFGVADELRRQLPKVKIEVVHGQMDGATLEEKMLRFYRGEAHVLLTTAIIESGLDIPRANTIIMDQAHYFGLAQLYQLRGRVGRSEKRAYCYLLVPGENLIGEDAKQRLQVIQRYSELGSGFNVASHDLEIRGAGDLLGKEQSGHLNAVGVDMYFELLEDAMRELRGEIKKVEIEPEISMKLGASFPNDYLPDVSERVLLYRRLSSVENEEAVSEIEVEIRDRFGTLPVEVENLLGLMRMKIYLKKLHVVRMSCGPKRTSLQFAQSTPASPEALVKLIQEDPDDRYSLTPEQKLVYEVSDTDWRGQLRELVRLCDLLGIPA